MLEAWAYHLPTYIQTPGRMRTARGVSNILEKARKTALLIGWICS